MTPMKEEDVSDDSANHTEPRSRGELVYPMVIRMAPEMHQAVKDRAAKDDRSMAWIIRRALSEYLGTGGRDNA